jgi:hypothetical protein
MRQNARCPGQPSVAAGAGVAATRVGDAAHGILRESGGDCAEAEEGSKRECEREFHDPSPLVQGITIEDGPVASRGKPSHVRSIVEAPTNRYKAASFDQFRQNRQSSAAYNPHAKFRSE